MTVRRRPATPRAARAARSGRTSRSSRAARSRREVDSVRWAVRGVRSAVAHEPHLRFHAAATVVVAVVAVLLRVPAAQGALLALAVGLVWVAELVNTATERLVDLVSPRFDPLAGQVKDIAAGAVLTAAVVAVAVGVLVLGPPLVTWVRSTLG